MCGHSRLGKCVGTAALGCAGEPSSPIFCAGLTSYFCFVILRPREPLCGERNEGPAFDLRGTDQY